MRHFAKIRFTVTAGFAFATILSAQQPTAASRPSPHLAEVTYTAGKLFVSANNSSLNQILRDIARQTGMKITGGVTDERVFGQYGPDAPSKILTTLLDGTGSNILLLQATGTTPAELILTPRQGGPTPPNPNAASFEDNSTDSRASQPIQPQERPQDLPANTRGNPNAEGSPQSSPNAVKTPQQIYEQLQRMRQQQQQQQPTSPP